MCARYTLIKGRWKVVSVVDIKRGSPLPLYNIAPTNDVPVIYQVGDQPEVDLFRWGLISFWSNGSHLTKAPLVNARSETAATLNSFKEPLKHRRCLVPADGYYEWRRERKVNQPYLFSMPDKSTFAFAGLWDSWTNPSDGRVIRSCAILTTEPNSFTAQFHNRMPAIILKEAYSLWLDPRVTDSAEVMPLLTPAPEDLLMAHAVSTYVNKSGNQGPDCVAPITLPAAKEEVAQQSNLFS